MIIIDMGKVHPNVLQAKFKSCYRAQHFLFFAKLETASDKSRRSQRKPGLTELKGLVGSR